VPPAQPKPVSGRAAGLSARTWRAWPARRTLHEDRRLCMCSGRQRRWFRSGNIPFTPPPPPPPPPHPPPNPMVGALPDYPLVCPLAFLLSTLVHIAACFSWAVYCLSRTRDESRQLFIRHTSPGTHNPPPRFTGVGYTLGMEANHGDTGLQEGVDLGYTITPPPPLSSTEKEHQVRLFSDTPTR